MSYLCRSWLGGGRGATPSRRRWRRRCRRSRSGPLVGCSPSARCASPSSPRRPSRRYAYLISLPLHSQAAAPTSESCSSRLQAFRTLRLTFRACGAPPGDDSPASPLFAAATSKPWPCFAQVQLSLLCGPGQWCPGRAAIGQIGIHISIPTTSSTAPSKNQ